MLSPSFRVAPPSAPPSGPPHLPPSSRGQRGGLAAVSIHATGDTSSIIRALQRAFAMVQKPAGLLLFATGNPGPAADPEAILEAVRAIMGPVPTVLAIGSGVRTETAEHEDTSALTGILWRQGRARTVGLERDAAPTDDFGSALATQVRAGGGCASALILFGQGDYLSSHSLADLAGHLEPTVVFGAGTRATGVWRIGSDGQIEHGPVAGIALHGMMTPIVRPAAACKLITPLAPITAVQGSVVLTIAERSALTVLSAGSKALHGQSLVLSVIARGSTNHDLGNADEILVRGIRGVDPTRGGIVVSDDVEPGMLMVFGVVEASTAKQQLSRVLRESSRQLAGGAPHFGLMLSCSGRVKSFYATPQVELGLFRERFPQVPMAGVLAPFEIAPFGGPATLHLYTTVVALFAAPS